MQKKISKALMTNRLSFGLENVCYFAVGALTLKLLSWL